MSDSSNRVILSADAVYNGVGLPVVDGGVLVAGLGEARTVVAFGKLGVLRAQYPEVRVERVGRAILPAPVNAHTHLDLSGFAFSSAPYSDWMRALVAQMVANRALRGVDAARRGLEVIARSGAGAFGDIVARPDVMDMLLGQSPLPGVAYWEVFERDPAKAQEVFAQTVSSVRRWRSMERPSGVRVGLSPHTPMTVSSVLMRELVNFARLEGLPVQIHVAESPLEVELFQTGAGALADVYRAWGMPGLEETIARAPSPDLTPVKYLAELGVLEARPTLVHAVNVTEEDVRIIAQYGCPVVTCPRSNAALHCGTFPWALYARYGVEVGLGTDSVASGETLSIFDEMQAALETHGASNLATIVRWAVKGGYKALGMKPPVVARGDAFSRLAMWA